ncbi:CheR family methyltransferase [Salinisphaera sp.]|uniref:CheR family methyltransferase n=1 Tax=Salinisphaera sp. TaxID=1914330 RepID=UPI002D78B9C6|nr:CheR family methyltransferase [Salinisphaera sp.]HET7313061.1 CheR family methyltransferase [Salinisphaera sp.]
MAKDADKNAGLSRAGKNSEAERPLVVGIGASAGGLNAFKTFFDHMPADSGMVFVLVQHLAPDHQSMLAELLGAHTRMPIRQAEDGTAVAADHVYTIAPGTTLTIQNGRLCVDEPGQARAERRLIDAFFSSLAADQGEYAVCIVLSGSGSDGTTGLKSVKEYGGFALAQAGLDEGVGSSMPASATATGLVDFCISIADMPAKLAEYARHLSAVAPDKDADGNRRDAAEHLRTISAILYEQLGHDFGQYKQSTLTRRVQRRMQVLQVDTMAAYVGRLRAEPEEQRLLFNDLLIGVTQFFRDPMAWQSLENTVLPSLLEHKPAGEQLRVWVPGCGAGDEVYSMAILITEALEAHRSKREAQIFGTDIDERAVETARTGRYAKPPAGLSEARRARFFTQEDDGAWRPSKKIRGMCVFAPHSVIKDPPFSRLDLISCRNLLIYMDSVLQDQVLRRLHYGLKPGGWLFLGSAEGVSRHDDLFETVEKKHRLFRRRETGAAEIPDFTSPVSREPRRHDHPPERATKPAAGGRIARAALGVMEKHAMPYVVVDADFRIVHFSGGPLTRFLAPAAGEARFDLFAMLKRPLRQVARAVLTEAFSGGEPAKHPNVPFRIEGRPAAANLIAEPFNTSGYGGGDTRLCVLAFQETPAGGDESAEPPADGRDTALEHELKVTKAQLNTAIRELETSNEEMRSANEEYQSVNEELQSTNEELETSKEEMQSVNEELQTVNSELSHKNDELIRTNSDLRNLLESTQIATLFLDRALNVRNFTPAVRDLFHLRDGDTGRPVTEIVSRLDYDDIKRDADKVLRELTMVERELEISDTDRRAYIMRIRPYRTVSDVIDGVVLTFTDITERKRGEAALRASEERLQRALEIETVGVLFSDPQFRLTEVNDAFLKMSGFSRDEALGKTWQQLTPPDFHENSNRAEAELRDHGYITPYEKQYYRKDGSRGWGHFAARMIGEEAVEFVIDITARKQAEAHRELLMHELSHRVKNTLATVQSLMTQSRDGAAGVGDFIARFGARLRALSSTHDLLTENHWRGTDLRDIVDIELMPYMRDDHPQWTLRGESVPIGSKTAVALGLAFHELATNAAKYGALSVAEGRIEVSWAMEPVDGAQRLCLDWTEHGGPSPEQPEREGFGLRLIRDGLAHELDAEITVTFAEQGLRCDMRVPLDADGEGGRL